MFRKIAVVMAMVALGALWAAAPAATAPAFAKSHNEAPGAGRGTSATAVIAAQRIRDLIRDNPGAQQISPTSVRYKAAILGFTMPGQRSAASPASESEICPDDWLCLFQDVNFNYWGYDSPTYWIKFYSCGVNFNLTRYNLTSSESWADRASSIDYPGSADGHEAKFNHDGDQWLYLYRDHYLKNLTDDGGPSPHGNSNDWITGLYVC
jgi:hypothetical protein